MDQHGGRTGYLGVVVSAAGVLAMLAASACGGCSSAASKGRAGTGVSKEVAQPGTFTGMLKSGFAGIGGESTGWMLESKDLPKSLEIDVSAVAAQAAQLDGTRVRVWGRVVERKYVERGTVLVLKADRIEAVPASK